MLMIGNNARVNVAWLVAESDGSSSQRGGGGSVGILGLDNLDYTVTMLELRRQREENSQSTSPDTTSVTQQGWLMCSTMHTMACIP